MAEGETFKATAILRTDQGTAIVFDFGFVDLTSGTGHVDTGTAAGDFQTLVQATMVAALPDNVVVRRYRFACVGGAHKGEIGYVEVNPTVPGQQSPSVVLPPEIAISLKRRTGYSSRKDRGRIFFGPVSGDYQDPVTKDGVLTDTPLQNMRDLLKANLTTQTRVLHPVILAADGTYTGRTVAFAEINTTFVHRKTRRTRVGS